MTAKGFKKLTYSDLPLDLQREIVGMQHALRVAAVALAEATTKSAHEHSRRLNDAAVAYTAILPPKEVEKVIAAMDAFREQSKQGSTTAQVGDRITGLGWVGHDQQPAIATNGSRIPNYYRPGGIPLRWQDDQTGELVAAVTAYFEQVATTEQLALVVDFCRYYASAPCWQDPHGAIAELVRETPLIRTRADLDQWLDKALHEGLDPF